MTATDDGSVSQRLEQLRLAGAAGFAHITRFSLRLTHSRVARDGWVGSGIDDTSGFRLSKVLPVGNPTACRLMLIDDACLPTSSSARSARRASAGSHRWALAVAKNGTEPGDQVNR